VGTGTNLSDLATTRPNESKTGHDSPLPQLEVVSAGFQATRPDFILRGLRRRRYFVDCLQRNVRFISFGKWWLRLPPLVESDGINLMFSGEITNVDGKFTVKIPGRLET